MVYGGGRRGKDDRNQNTLAPFRWYVGFRAVGELKRGGGGGRKTQTHHFVIVNLGYWPNHAVDDDVCRTVTNHWKKETALFTCYIIILRSSQMFLIPGCITAFAGMFDNYNWSNGSFVHVIFPKYSALFPRYFMCYLSVVVFQVDEGVSNNVCKEIR